MANVSDIFLAQFLRLKLVLNPFMVLIVKCQYCHFLVVDMYHF